MGRDAQLSYPPIFDLVVHLYRQRAFSLKAFGPNQTARGVADHIRKELTEIEASGGALEEWVDVMLLAFDGAMRSGAKPEQVADAITAKQSRNERRTWPDWRKADPDRAIEHHRRDGE
jgi:hypothetical protein